MWRIGGIQIITSIQGLGRTGNGRSSSGKRTLRRMLDEIEKYMGYFLEARQNLISLSESDSKGTGVRRSTKTNALENERGT